MNLKSRAVLLLLAIIACTPTGVVSQTRIDFNSQLSYSFNTLSNWSTTTLFSVDIESVFSEIETTDFPFVFSQRLEVSGNPLNDPSTLNLSYGIRMYRGYNYESMYISFYPIYALNSSFAFDRQRQIYLGWISSGLGFGFSSSLGSHFYWDVGAVCPFYWYPVLTAWLPDLSIGIGLKI